MNTKIQAVRYHDISVGHTVYKHESKCSHLHGHNYRIWFYVEADKLDSVGRVLDFSVIKDKLCEWLEENWDHKFLVFGRDPRASTLELMDKGGVVIVPFNPTAENMANYLLMEIGPKQLPSHAALTKVMIEETAKCHVIAER